MSRSATATRRSMDAAVRLGAWFKDDKTNLPNVMLPDERYGLLHGIPCL